MQLGFSRIVLLFVISHYSVRGVPPPESSVCTFVRHVRFIEENARIIKGYLGYMPLELDRSLDTLRDQIDRMTERIRAQTLVLRAQRLPREGQDLTIDLSDVSLNLSENNEGDTFSIEAQASESPS